MDKMRIAITPGEPAAIGPELMYHLIESRLSPLRLNAKCQGQAIDFDLNDIELVIIGNKDLITKRMSIFGNDFYLDDFEEHKFKPSINNHLSIIDVALNDEVIAGKLNPNNASYVLKTLDIAIDGCLKKSTSPYTFDALVTGPISKSVINQGLNPNHQETEIFSGHTEYLQAKCNCPEVVMLLGAEQMNVALATTHLALKDVASALSKDKLKNIIRILYRDLKSKFGFSKPKIYICGLNPHAGEDGLLGTEEIEIIIPAINELIKDHEIEPNSIVGPLAADTIFQTQYLQDASAILTMYHDQGLPVLKYVAFDSGYNTTLGLPIIRTSVDHGTALNLANKGVASYGSLHSALSLAIYMAKNSPK